MATIRVTKSKAVLEDLVVGMGLDTRGSEINGGNIPYSSSESISEAVDRKEDGSSVDSKLALKANLAGDNTQEFNVANATNPTEATSKQQVDTELALKEDITSVDTKLALKADLNGSVSEVFKSLQGTAPEDVVTLAKLVTELLLKADLTYVNSELASKADENNTLLKDGSSPVFTPVSENQPSTKKYVDDLVIAVGAGDMLKSIYDVSNTGAVDTSEAIGRVGTILGQTPMNQIMRLSQSNVTDCNILDDFGIFVGTDVANSPTSGMIGLEQLDVGGTKAQRCFSFTNNLWYDRVFNGTVWSGWSAWAKEDNVVSKVGDTMTGSLTMQGNDSPLPIDYSYSSDGFIAGSVFAVSRNKLRLTGNNDDGLSQVALDLDGVTKKVYIDSKEIWTEGSTKQTDNPDINAKWLGGIESTKHLAQRDLILTGSDSWDIKETEMYKVQDAIMNNQATGSPDSNKYGILVCLKPNDIEARTIQTYYPYTNTNNELVQIRMFNSNTWTQWEKQTQQKTMAGVGFDFYGTEATLIAQKGDTAVACNNQALKRVDYPELFANIGTIYDTFNGATAPSADEFRAPPQQVDDLGIYSRGVGATNGAVGTYQADVFKNHSHTIPFSKASATFTLGNNGMTIYQVDQSTSSEGDAIETRPRSITVLKCIWTGR